MTFVSSYAITSLESIILSSTNFAINEGPFFSSSGAIPNMPLYALANVTSLAASTSKNVNAVFMHTSLPQLVCMQHTSEDDLPLKLPLRKGNEDMVIELLL